MKSLVAAVLILAACAGTDADTDVTPEPAGGVEGSGIATSADSSWTPDRDSVASRVITVDGGTITLPRAFTVEIEPATLTDTQTVTVSLSRDQTQYPSAPAGPWFGKVSFARTCPPKPVHLTAVLPTPADASSRLLPHTRSTVKNPEFQPVSDFTHTDDGRLVRFTISERAFSSGGGRETRCDAVFAFGGLR